MLITDTSRPDASVLAGRLTGDAFGPADAGYDEHRVGFVLAVDLRPAIVALPENADDVRAIVDFAREHGLRIAPQATGHNAFPLGDLSDAILLKTSRMRGVEIDAERRVARVESGAWWIDVSAPASELGLAPLAGSSPDVGVAGYTLGGGSSWLVRKYGLGANNVVALEVVTPDGRLVRADHTSEPDLFWALRGGGGNFGVVTALELKLYELPEVYAGVFFYPVDRASEVLKTWRDITRIAPDEVTSVGRILNLPPIDEVPEMLRGKSFVTVEVVDVRGEAAGAELIQPLRDLGPEIDTFAMVPPVALSKLHMDPEGHVPAALSGTLLLDRLEDDAIDHVVSIVQPGSPLLMYEIRHVGGAAARSGDDHGVIDHMPGEYLTFGAGLPVVEGLAELIEAILGRVHDGLRTYSTGRQYLNFTEQTTSPETFFGPEKLARLRAIREQVDPARMMVSNHRI